jgi:RecG-like helicase
MSFLLRRQPKAAVVAHHSPSDAAVSISDALPRQRVMVAGQVMRMRSRPTSRQPSLVVTISDDSGSVTAVWTGRRSIGGISLGRRLCIEGVAVMVGDRLEFTNPAYTLLP